ncbi:hypothetical protein ACFLQI_00700 [Candidatus Undinarchaeota archaeon]
MGTYEKNIPAAKGLTNAILNAPNDKAMDAHINRLLKDDALSEAVCVRLLEADPVLAKSLAAKFPALSAVWSPLISPTVELQSDLLK